MLLVLSSHPHQQMVWLYWLQDRDSMPIWYTINHPTTLHTHSETQWPIAAHQWHFVLQGVSCSQSCHLLKPSHPWVPHWLILVSYNEIVFAHSIFITRFLTHSCMYFCVFSAALHTAHSVFAENISWDGWVLVGAHSSEWQKNVQKLLLTRDPLHLYLIFEKVSLKLFSKIKLDKLDFCTLHRPHCLGMSYYVIF